MNKRKLEIVQRRLNRKTLEYEILGKMRKFRDQKIFWDKQKRKQLCTNRKKKLETTLGRLNRKILECENFMEN